MARRNIAYKIWKIRKTVADRDRYGLQRRRENYLIPASKLHEKLLNPGLPAKYLWLYLASIEAKNTVYNVVVPQKELAWPSKTSYFKRIFVQQHFSTLNFQVLF
jgi:hypothetical protein